MISNEMIECIFETRFMEIILHVSNHILDKSQFSEIWKIGYIVPMFKREDSFDPSKILSLSSGKGKMFLCAACHAFKPHVNVWKN